MHARLEKLQTAWTRPKPIQECSSLGVTANAKDDGLLHELLCHAVIWNTLVSVVIDRHISGINYKSGARKIIVVAEQFMSQHPNVLGLFDGGHSTELCLPDPVHDRAIAIVLLGVFCRSPTPKSTHAAVVRPFLEPRVCGPSIPQEFKNRSTHAWRDKFAQAPNASINCTSCLLYTSDAADE